MQAIRKLTTTYFRTSGSRVRATFNHITRKFRVVLGIETLYESTFDSTTTISNLKAIFNSYAEEYH